ncbi:hypothetical protein Tco_0200979 [Tanacetum coccineum]
MDKGEHTIKLKKDMLRASAIEFRRKWDTQYTVSRIFHTQQLTTRGEKVSPIEALYGRKCRTPIAWARKNQDRRQLSFVEEPMEIMDREVKKLKKRWIPIVRVHWNSQRGPKFTWERKDQMKRKYPQLFASATALNEQLKFRDEIPYNGGKR